MEKAKNVSPKVSKRRPGLEPNVVVDPEEGAPTGPAVVVSAGPLAATKTADVSGFRAASTAIENRLRQKHAEVLILKGDAYGLAIQLESLESEYELKRGELRRAWEAAQRKIRTLGAAIEADEAALALLTGSK